MKKPALFALWIALAAECAFLLRSRLVPHSAAGHLTQPLVFVAIFATLAITRGRVGWITLVARVLLGVEFGLAVADRFGWFGPYGTKGVSWGDFAHFVAYTHQVNAFLPVSFAFPLAVLATVCESLAAVALILGLWLRYAGAGTALLLFFFGCAMTASGLNQSQFYYAVFVLAAGSWVIAASDPSWLSVDCLLRQRNPPPTPSI